MLPDVGAGVGPGVTRADGLIIIIIIIIIIT
jgi:hypothetical protein